MLVREAGRSRRIGRHEERREVEVGRPTDMNMHRKSISRVLIALALPALFVVSLTCAGCSEGLIMTGDHIEIEGRVDGVGGGPREGPIQIWYILRDCWWVAQQNGTVTPLGIDGPVESKYVGKHVRIDGRVYSRFEDGRIEYFVHIYSMRIIG